MLDELLAAYAANRANSRPLPGGSAPYTSSAAFKLRNTADQNASAKDWAHRLSREGALRTNSTLKAASRVENPKAVISLGTARPAAQYYPWQSLTIEGVDARHYQNNEELPTLNMSCRKGELAYDLGFVLNYGYAAGSPQVLRFITEHVEMLHNPPYADWESALTCGTTSAIEIIFRMLCDRGDTVLSEAFTYPGTLEAAKALGLRLCAADGPKPRVLYTIPTGQNPTGTSQTRERRAAIYEIAQTHDLLIIEDDPYYFIQLQELNIRTRYSHASANGLTNRVTNDFVKAPAGTTTSSDYFDGLPPSYLSLDTSGRVLRLDATSKILAPGLRCGWITACSQLIQKFINYTDMSTVSPSGPSQALLYKLLDESWGHEGFFGWLSYLSKQYSHKLGILVTACEQNLPRGLCQWTIPSAGMFLWIRVDWTHHSVANVKDSGSASSNEALVVEDKIYRRTRDLGVLVSKGSWFATDPMRCRNVYFRLTFAAAADDDIKQAVRIFGKAICSEFEISQ